MIELDSFTAPLAQYIKHMDMEPQVVLDDQLFGDANFVCEPSSGVVLPGGECEVTVRFSPDFAREYATCAYVEVQGRTQRLPITFKAQGLVSRCAVTQGYAGLSRGHNAMRFSFACCSHTRTAGTCGGVQL
jgi:hypothetical protein